MSVQPSPPVKPPFARSPRRRIATGRPQTPLLIALLVAALVLLAFLLPRVRPQGAPLPAEGGTLVETAVGPVARINPLRWIQDDPPPLEDVLRTMRDRAVRFKVDKIRPQDLARAAGPMDDEG